jgi:hypothetical protein
MTFLEQFERIGGKALYVAQYFRQIGVPVAFDGYQCGWVVPHGK